MRTLRTLCFGLAFLSSAAALSLSWLVGPVSTGPGSPAGFGISELQSLDVETFNLTRSIGYLNITSDASSPSSTTPCTVSPMLQEAALCGVQDDLTLYTVCTAPIQGVASSVLAKTTILGGDTYSMLGYTSSISNRITRLATDNGTNFYLLGRQENGNSTLHYVTQGSDIVEINNTTNDGWQLQHIEILGGQLFGIGNRLGRATTIITWGRGLPFGPALPQPYPGFPGGGSAGNGGGIGAFRFSDPSTLWVLNLPSGGVVGVAPMLMMYIYNKQTFSWTVGGYYMFNASFPAPQSIFLGGKAPIAKFHGIAPSGVFEYTFPTGGGGGTTSSTLGTRQLVAAARGTTFRGLSVTAWTPTPIPSPTATAASTATATATASSTSSASATATATATMSSTSSARSSQTSLPTFSALPTPTTQYTTQQSPSVTPSGPCTPTGSTTMTPTMTPTQTATPSASRSFGASPAETPTQTPSSSPSPSPSPTPSQTPTPSVVGNSSAANAATGISGNQEALELGFGIGVPLLILVVSAVVLFMLFKSGKLFLLCKKKPDYMRRPYGNGGRAPRAPSLSRSHPMMLRTHPVLTQNPLAGQQLNMAVNQNLFKQLRTSERLERAEEAKATVVEENGDRYITKTRVLFRPMKSALNLPGAVV